MTERAQNGRLFGLRDITKSFGNLVAIQNVMFEVDRGEIVGLVGDNGAGKSTLVKVMNGFYSPDRGEIEFDGRTVRFSSPRDARSVGEHTTSTVVQSIVWVIVLDAAFAVVLQLLGI